MTRIRRLLGVLVFAALLGVGFSWERSGARKTYGSPAPAASEPVAQNTFRLVWSHSLPGLKSAAISADGKAIAAVSDNGTITFWRWASRPQSPIWTKKIPSTDALLASSRSNSAIAYSRLQPTRREIFFIGAKGQMLGKCTADGAIWDMALSPDQSAAAAASGNNSVYYFSLGSKISAKRYALDGIGNSVCLLETPPRILVGEWDSSGVRCIQPGSGSLWTFPASAQERARWSDRLFQAEYAQNDEAMLALSCANASDEDGRLYYWLPGEQVPLWSRSLGTDAISPSALISQNGAEIAVAYTRDVAHEDHFQPERTIMLLDSRGNMLWKKGGLLFAPQLVSLAADGRSVTVSDGNQTLYHLEIDGRFASPYRLRAPLMRTYASADGRWLLAYTSDGSLNLLEMD